MQTATQAFDSRTQINLFEQCKTVIEAEIQFFFAVKDSGGNPKAVEMHPIVEESAEQLAIAVADLQRNINLLDSEAGGIHGIVDSISRSISLADQTRQTPAGDSFADAQTRMLDALNEIARISQDMPVADSQELGHLSLQLAERYKELTGDARIAGKAFEFPNSFIQAKKFQKKIAMLHV